MTRDITQTVSPKAHVFGAPDDARMTIVGLLAQILAFGQKTTAASTGGGGTSLMVAGDRNHLNLLFNAPRLVTA